MRLSRTFGGLPFMVAFILLPLAGCASGPRWQEEVVTFDGSKVVVERHVILDNLLNQEFSDIRHGAPPKGNMLRAPLSTSTWTSNWEALGLNPQAIGRVGGTWHLSATPMRCEGYDKWGRPVPPYVFFRYSGDTWQRITVGEFPAEIVKRNLTYFGPYDQRSAASSGFISAEKGPHLNPGLPDYVNDIYRSGVRGFEGCKRRLEALDANREPKPAAPGR